MEAGTRRLPIGVQCFERLREDGFLYDARRQRYTLGFPNEEVKYGLLECLMPEYVSNWMIPQKML